ncbi:hypothetical protein [Butyrivibrio sp. AE3004]|uniref:hypothetical protein n=1 Tax=Butyrivibrio sp. AE3004 TaxID=1506994 RepID=UPI000494C133|nr:hypothetical protein [Butyrivibrio sp. AE3004]
MRNEQIIAQAAVENNIISQLQAVEMLDNNEGNKIPLHTAAMWKSMGREKGIEYRIREDATGIPVKLWKKRKSDTATDKYEFYLSKAILYSEKDIEIVSD